MERPLLEVVIVAYGAAELLDKCLSALGSGWQVHVIDNSASPDVEACTHMHRVGYVACPDNPGFAAGVNRGLTECSPVADVLILNPDAEITPEGVRQLHIALHRDPRIAAVAPTLLRADGSHEPTEWPMPTPGLPWRGIIGRTGSRNAKFLSGAVLLISAAARARVGGFDERFFLYAEEADWQRRAVALGWQLEHVPASTARHSGAGTSSDSALRELYFHASAETYLRKWYGGTGWQLARVGSFLSAMRRAVTGTPDERRRARATARLYLQGPQRALRRYGAAT